FAERGPWPPFTRPFEPYRGLPSRLSLDDCSPRGTRQGPALTRPGRFGDHTRGRSPRLHHHQRLFTREDMPMRRRVIIHAALSALPAGVLALGWPADAAAQRKFSFAYDQPTTTAYGIAANIFDEKLKQLSGGKLSINQFPGAQLGTEPQTLQKLRAGDIDFVITATANAASVAPQAGVFSLHFIFRDEQHLAKALADKQVSDAFRAMIKDSVLVACTRTFRPLMSSTLVISFFAYMFLKKEITRVEDIKGLKVRVQVTK